MPLNAQEQYLLELINRGRLDPAAEAERYGIDLNASLGPGTITTQAKQVFAPNALLENAAIGHSQWMLATDVFSHVGEGGSTLGTRATAATYAWNLLGENIAVWGTSATLDTTAAIEAHHRGLFLSAGHRTNLMNGNLSEIGLAQETGDFAFSGGPALNASMLTELFGNQSGGKYLTGVAYRDSDGDGYYSVGEGRASTEFRFGTTSALTDTPGGYALRVVAAGDVLVSGRAGDTDFSVSVDFSDGNVKLDVVNGKRFESSADVKLGTGINKVELLGNADLNAAGNAEKNRIVGNIGSNLLEGGDGRDRIFGGVGDDSIMGGRGNDRLQGDAGNDVLVGGGGADSFRFGNGSGMDVIDDFNKGQGDRLALNDDLWAEQLSTSEVVSKFASVTAQGVVFDFGDGDMLTLSDVQSTAGLADLIVFW